ncbi:MAG: cyclase family protein [Bacteroidetes bacterium]|nr:cyclase family protein [Bacteroidota bacterium]
MQVQCIVGNATYSADLSGGYDLSVGIGPGGDNPNAFFIDRAEFEPFRAGGFIGNVSLGGSANCEVIRFCAHGNGTHTECVGHLSRDRFSLNRLITRFVYTAQLVTVTLNALDRGEAITRQMLEGKYLLPVDALIVRTIPNDDAKKGWEWSGHNPPFFAPETLAWLRDCGYRHLLTDLPSVDPEEDEGLLSAHHAWWNYPEAPREDSTITEMIYVDNGIKDGLYLLNLQFPPFESDASPSRPVIYPLV